MLLLGVIGVMVFEKEDEPKRNVVINEENVNEIIAEMEKNEFVPPGSYEAKMNATWIFPDGKSVSENAYVENVVRNTNDVYFDVILSETDEVIYESPLLPVGSHIENITLDKELEKGTYDCVVIYHLVDEEQNTLSTVRVAVTIVIEN